MSACMLSISAHIAATTVSSGGSDMCTHTTHMVAVYVCGYTRTILCLLYTSDAADE